MPYDKPIGRTREIIEICRQVWAPRGAARARRPALHVPLPAGQGTGLGKPLKIINHPVRADIPIYVASLGDEERRAHRRDRRRLAAALLPAREGRARCGAPRSPRAPPSATPALGPLRDRAPAGCVAIGDEADGAGAARLDPPAWSRSTSAAWAPRAELLQRRSSAATATRPRPSAIQDLYLDGKKDEAARSSPRTSSSRRTSSAPRASSETASRRSAGRRHAPAGHAHGCERARRRRPTALAHRLTHPRAKGRRQALASTAGSGRAPGRRSNAAASTSAITAPATDDEVDRGLLHEPTAGKAAEGHHAAEPHDPERHDLAAHCVVDLLLQHGRQRRDDREVGGADRQHHGVGDGRHAHHAEHGEQRPRTPPSTTRRGGPCPTGRTPCRSTALRHRAHAERGVEHAVAIALGVDAEVPVGDRGHLGDERQAQQRERGDDDQALRHHPVAAGPR